MLLSWLQRQTRVRPEGDVAPKLADLDVVRQAVVGDRQQQVLERALARSAGSQSSLIRSAHVVANPGALHTRDRCRRMPAQEVQRNRKVLARLGFATCPRKHRPALVA